MLAKQHILPPSRLTGVATRASLRRFNWSAGFRSVFDTVGGGTTFIFVAFAQSLGLASERTGWMTFLVSCACVLQMLALPVIARTANKKRYALSLALAEPLLAIAAVGLALLLPAPARLYAFGAAVFLAAASINLSRPVTDDWLATTIPAALRGRYLGRRMQIVGVVTVAATLAAGWLGDRIGLNNTTGLAAVLGGGAACGLVAVILLREVPMPDGAANSQPRLADAAGALRTPSFFRLLLLVVIYCLPFYFACAYYQVFHLEVLKMPAFRIAQMMSGYYVIKIVSLPLLGRIVDRWGVRRTMFISGVVYAGFFAIYPLCQPGWYWPLFIAWAFVGMADGAFGLATQMALYGAVPESPARPAYFAVYNIVTIAFTGLGGAVAVPVLESIKHLHLSVGPLEFTNFHLLYAGCALVMLPCMCSAYLVIEPRKPVSAS